MDNNEFKLATGFNTVEAELCDTFHITHCQLIHCYYKKEDSCVCVCGLTAAGQCNHIGGFGWRADPPAVGGSHSELIVTTGNQSVNLNTLLPAAGHLLP